MCDVGIRQGYEVLWSVWYRNKVACRVCVMLRDVGMEKRDGGGCYVVCRKERN